VKQRNATITVKDCLTNGMLTTGREYAGTFSG